MPLKVHVLVALRRARDLIDREYARPLNVPAMAAAAYMSPAHFSPRFSELMGMSPSAYRDSDHGDTVGIPGCMAMVLTRPSRNGEPGVAAAPVASPA